MSSSLLQKVGGIVANQEALADFMYDNMTLEMNVIHSAWKNGCKNWNFLDPPVFTRVWHRSR